MKAPLRPGNPGVWRAYTCAQIPSWWGFHFTSSYYNLRAKRTLRTFNQAMDEAAANVKPPTGEKMRAIYLVDRGYRADRFWSKAYLVSLLVGFCMALSTSPIKSALGKTWALIFIGVYFIAFFAVTSKVIVVKVERDQ